MFILAFEFLNPGLSAGPGVDKNRPEKKRFFLFFELYFRRFGKMMYTSLLYCLTLIPSAALAVLGSVFFPAAPLDLLGLALGLALIGPSTCGLTYLLRQAALERPVFVWHDFWSAFRKNFKQALLFSALDALVIFLIVTSMRFCIAILNDGIMQFIFVVFYCVIALVILIMHYYVYPMMITLDLRISQIIKNALILSISALKTNLITTFFVLLLVIVPAVLIQPEFLLPILVILVPLFYAAFVGFIIVFNSFQHIKRLLIDPYYETHPEERKNNPFGFIYEEDEDEEDVVFTDLGTLEKKVVSSSAAEEHRGGKIIS